MRFPLPDFILSSKLKYQANKVSSVFECLLYAWGSGGVSLILSHVTCLQAFKEEMLFLHFARRVRESLGG